MNLLPAGATHSKGKGEKIEIVEDKQRNVLWYFGYQLGKTKRTQLSFIIDIV